VNFLKGFLALKSVMKLDSPGISSPSGGITRR
jgi:hypothetical protein